MKRTAVILLCFVMMLCLIGCAQQEEVTEQEESVSTEIIQFAQGEISDSVSVELKDEDGRVWLDNEHIEMVYARYNEMNGYYIELELTKEGTSQFGEATRENVGRTIAVCVDGEVLIAPIVEEEISSEVVVIADNESEEALKTLYRKLTK